MAGLAASSKMAVKPGQGIRILPPPMAALFAPLPPQQLRQAARSVLPSAAATKRFDTAIARALRHIIQRRARRPTLLPCGPFPSQ